MAPAAKKYDDVARLHRKIESLLNEARGGVHFQRTELSERLECDHDFEEATDDLIQSCELKVEMLSRLVL